jgi:hypothetical protein
MRRSTRSRKLNEATSAAGSPSPAPSLPSPAPSPPRSKSPTPMPQNPLATLDPEFYAGIPEYPHLRVPSGGVDFNQPSVSLTGQPWSVLLKTIAEEPELDDDSPLFAFGRDTESHILPPDNINSPKGDAVCRSSSSKTLKTSSKSRTVDRNPPSLTSSRRKQRISSPTKRGPPPAYGVKRRKIPGYERIIGWMFSTGVLFCHVNGTRAICNLIIHLAHVMVPVSQRRDAAKVTIVLLTVQFV